MKKPDAGNPLVRFDEGRGIGILPLNPPSPAYSTVLDYDSNA